MPVAHTRLPAQIGQRTIDLVVRNRTALDVDQTTRIMPEKTDHAVLCVDGDAIAIAILFRRQNNWPHQNFFKFADPLESIAHLAPFDGELMLIIDVLISAAA